ncbi:cytochrome c oxidase subunit 3 [Sporichthya polymorpha]|uniref:cytochrome c oxidase subunit 3 n=1 Tax=Sporichthya polymorpha TaxID=35751 RepID=UPI00048D0C90|nr:cytochrome c oxidase subunit 3 [Sporichthya polymorpha]
MKDSPNAHLPGEAGVWVFIFGDMLAFAVFFVTFTIARGGDPDLFNTSARELEVTFGVVNTLLLLSSSWFVATAVRAVRAGERMLASRLLGGAIACGLGFVGSKAVEWSAKVDSDITPTTNVFFTYYFTFTGIHLLHLLLGLLGLVIMLRVVRRPPRPSNQLVLEAGATFWHMVDLLWIVLFPLLYLMR